ncbi:MAG: B12-binding domain-containing radical SAM protein [Promethearchaeota archaeon]
MGKKILFVHPFNMISGLDFEKEFPIHLIYLSSYLKVKQENQVDIRFLDLAVERMNDPRISINERELIKNLFKNRIDEFNFSKDDPLFIIISCFNSFHYIPVKVILSILKEMANEKEIPFPVIILGGYHPTVIPEDFMNSFVDVIIRGEGEITLNEVINTFDTESKIFRKEKNKKPIILNGIPVKELDDLPIPRFELYSRYISNYSHLSISLSRGCPFSCMFCLENGLRKYRAEKLPWRVYGKTRTQKEFNNVMNATESWMDQGKNKYIGIYDPIFGFNRKWRQDILEFLASNNRGFTFWGETRIDTLTLNDIKRLKQANFFLMLGFETASPKMLRLMNKTRNPAGYLKNLEKTLEAATNIGHGPFVLNVLFNFPGETRKTIQETFSFINQLIDKDLFFYTAETFYMVFPGDGIFNDMKRWEHEHGTHFYNKNWWKDPDLVMSADLMDASDNLKFNDAARIVHDGLVNLFKRLGATSRDPVYKFFFLKKIKKAKENFNRRINAWNNQKKELEVALLNYSR